MVFPFVIKFNVLRETFLSIIQYQLLDYHKNTTR